MSQTTINPDAPLVTLINVFTVAPEDQQRLITLWQHATDDIISQLPGFISANIHASPGSQGPSTHLNAVRCRQGPSGRSTRHAVDYGCAESIPRRRGSRRHRIDAFSMG